MVEAFYQLKKTLLPLFIDEAELFTTQYQRVSGAHFINLGRIIGWIGLRANCDSVIEPGIPDWKSSTLKAVGLEFIPATSLRMTLPQRFSDMCSER